MIGMTIIKKIMDELCYGCGTGFQSGQWFLCNILDRKEGFVQVKYVAAMDGSKDPFRLPSTRVAWLPESMVTYEFSKAAHGFGQRPSTRKHKRARRGQDSARLMSFVSRTLAMASDR